jgi:large subunit ribosomal protein L54
LQQQTIDLPGNVKGTIEGGFEAQEERDKLRKAMRGERRKSIKEGNYLKGMR